MEYWSTAMEISIRESGDATMRMDTVHLRVLMDRYIEDNGGTTFSMERESRFGKRELSLREILRKGEKTARAGISFHQGMYILGSSEKTDLRAMESTSGKTVMFIRVSGKTT